MLDVRGVKLSGPQPCGCAGCAAAPWPASGFGRRRFLTLGMAAGLAAGAGLAAPLARAEPAVTPDAALERLMAGNRRYVAADMTSYGEDLALQKSHTVEKQG